MLHPWPGNIRELAATMERAVLLGEGRLLDIPGALGMTNVSGGIPEQSPGIGRNSLVAQKNGLNTSILFFGRSHASPH